MEEQRWLERRSSGCRSERRPAGAKASQCCVNKARRWEKLAQRTKPRLLQEAAASQRCGSASGCARSTSTLGPALSVTARQPIAEAVGAPMHALVLRSARILTRRHSLLSVRSYGTPLAPAPPQPPFRQAVPHPLPPTTLGYKARRARHLLHLCPSFVHPVP